jgi:hypothetical protein
VRERKEKERLRGRREGRRKLRILGVWAPGCGVLLKV